MKKEEKESDILRTQKVIRIVRPAEREDSKKKKRKDNSTNRRI